MKVGFDSNAGKVLTLLCLFVVSSLSQSDELLDGSMSGHSPKASCDLLCSNGGYCTLIPGTSDELAKQAQKGTLIETCVCPPGFTGLACENILEQCVLPERKCYNGAPCIQHESTGEWACDCTLADSLSTFAGQMCRDPITEYCTGRYIPDTALSFCTNGGRCLADFIAAKVAPGDTSVNRQYQHAGCSCPPEFYGPHCEFLSLNAMDGPEARTYTRGKDDEDKIDVNGGSSRATKITVVIMLGALLFLGGLICYKKRQIIKRQRYIREMQQQLHNMNLNFAVGEGMDDEEYNDNYTTQTTNEGDDEDDDMSVVADSCPQQPRIFLVDVQLD